MYSRKHLAGRSLKGLHLLTCQRTIYLWTNFHIHSTQMSSFLCQLKQKKGHAKPHLIEFPMESTERLNLPNDERKWDWTGQLKKKCENVFQTTASHPRRRKKEGRNNIQKDSRRISLLPKISFTSKTKTEKNHIIHLKKTLFLSFSGEFGGKD